MTCENCGHENSADASYCAACGVPTASPEEPPGAVEDDSPQGDPLSEEGLVCQNCGGEVRTESSYCAACGTPTRRREEPPDLRQVDSPPDVPRPQQGVTCRNCGGENLPEAAYCASCGVFMSGPPDSRQYTPADGDLRTRDLGGLLHETFRIYTRNLWVFVLIAVVPQIPIFLSNSDSIVANILFSLIGFALGLIAGGASIFAVAQHYVDRRIDVGVCLGHALQLAVILIISAMVVAIVITASLVLSFVLIGIPILCYFLVIWAFGSHAIVIEGTGPFTGLVRSRNLVRGSWWRVFGIGLVFVLIVGGVFGAIIIPVTILPQTIFSGPQSPYIVNAITSIVSVLVFPFASIGATLVYIDLRVRKEGFNLETLASEIRRR